VTTFLKPNMLITAAWLTERHACVEQVRKFRRKYPNGAKLTRKNLLAARAAGFDVLWLTDFMDPSAWAEYVKASAPALAEYDKASAPAWAEYVKASAPAWAEYDKARAGAWTEYVKASAPAWTEYVKASAPAWAEYDKARAAAGAEYDKARAGALIAALFPKIKKGKQ
jgi:hypothetical protein